MAISKRFAEWDIRWRRFHEKANFQEYLCCSPLLDADCYMDATYLCDAHYKGAGKLGRGIGYKYAHDYPNHYVEQQYLPDAYKDMKFYEPTENGYEQTIREYFKKIKQE